MNQGIVVGTWSGGSESCEILLRSLYNVQYPVLIVINDVKNTPPEWFQKLYLITGEQGWHINGLDFDGFELGAIAQAYDHTEWDEFIFLQDTFEIKNQDIFRILFDDYKGRSVSYNPYLQMYLLKYRREVLAKINIPEVRKKREAIRLEEVFNREYEKADGNIHIFNPRFTDDNFYGNYEERFGRRNLKMEDDYLIKRKGTWTTEQIPVE